MLAVSMIYVKDNYKPKPPKSRSHRERCGAGFLETVRHFVFSNKYLVGNRPSRGICLKSRWVASRTTHRQTFLRSFRIFFRERVRANSFD
jgi:hypothetical protein